MHLDKKIYEDLYKEFKIDPYLISLNTWIKGIDVELEHLETTNNDMYLIANIVIDHLNEDLNYYDYLEDMEELIIKKRRATYGMAKGIYSEIFLMHEGHRFIDPYEIKSDIYDLKNFDGGYIAECLEDFFDDYEKSIECWKELQTLKIE